MFNIEISGSGIGGDHFSVVARPGPGIQVTGASRSLQAEHRTYGATFTHVVNPVRPIVGTVRDRATGKPLSGVQVDTWGPANVFTFTDENGKYRLVGHSKAKEYSVTAWPWNSRP